MHPSGDTCWSNPGVHEVSALANAVLRSGVKLDSLTLAGISQDIFNTPSPALRDLMRPLRQLRILSPAWSREEDSDSEPDSDFDFDSEVDLHDTERLLQHMMFFEKGVARKVLAEARELRVLKLKLPPEDPVRFAPLGPTLKGILFPHLYELALSQCSVTGDFLVNLLLRHKTLRRITLRDIRLLEYSTGWRDVFTKLSGQLPQLRKVTLWGEFSSNRNRRSLTFYASPKSEAMEAFIIKGGIYPSRNSTTRPPQEPRLDESEDDVSSAYPPDDPAREYEWDTYDEFDDI